MKKIVIVIPTYNEKENIYKLTKILLKLLPQSTIYIIDDTKSYSLNGSFKSKRIKYFLRRNKRGRGSAVLFGLKKSLKNLTNNIFLEMDSDFSHSPKEIKNNLKFFKSQNLDLLISSRYLPKSKILNWNFSRRVFSFLANFLAQLLLMLDVTDYTNGFRIYSKKAIKIITKKCGKIGDGFIILSEILLILKINNCKINEVSSIFVNRKRGESSVNFSLIMNSFFGLLKLFFIKLNLYNPYK